MSERTENEVSVPSSLPRGQRRKAPLWAVVCVATFSFLLLSALALDRITITSKVLTSPGQTRSLAPMLTVDDVQTYGAEGRIGMVTVKSNLEPSLLELIGGCLLYTSPSPRDS